MINFDNINKADELYTVFLKETATQTTDENGDIITSHLGGVGYWSGLPKHLIMPVTFQVVPIGRPFLVMLRQDVPNDYDTNMTFINSLDFSNADGIGT